MPTFEDIYADKVEDDVPNVACCFEGELSLSCDCISGAATAERRRGIELFPT